ncbi:cyclase family protein [Urechidicola croceus]|uniref:Metal-dependent hydrolase n=1 Tax=Urechidicola croceus TaxID=1850246 RepID=A0A1D8P7E9_9FLAO|nr:cyclase family protein [Urechidicola croceus]AOW20503.1 metal-dependent hydrolase [Urechidicola croceus]
MKTTIKINNKKYKVNLSKPIDISLPLLASEKNVNAWYLEPPKIEPVVDRDWVGSVDEGASVNFNTIEFNPHAHGTHTECIGHITKEFHSINDCLKKFFFNAELITVLPEKSKSGDKIISKTQLESNLKYNNVKAIIIRTKPNSDAKLSKQYSNSNPPYLSEEAAVFIRKKGIKHLLIDLPSVDKEKDDGKLLAHKAFWNYDKKQRLDATITELIYVKDEIEDGMYLLNLQIASFENDASPSKPILYKLR